MRGAKFNHALEVGQARVARAAIFYFEGDRAAFEIGDDVNLPVLGAAPVGKADCLAVVTGDDMLEKAVSTARANPSASSSSDLPLSNTLGARAASAR